ncbi:hypothetical protein V8F20_003893 [Naviculisporaceae sp. PSN 640]
MVCFTPVADDNSAPRAPKTPRSAPKSKKTVDPAGEEDGDDESIVESARCPSPGSGVQKGRPLKKATATPRTKAEEDALLEAALENSNTTIKSVKREANVKDEQSEPAEDHKTRVTVDLSPESDQEDLPTWSWLKPKTASWGRSPHLWYRRSRPLSDLGRPSPESKKVPGGDGLHFTEGRYDGDGPAGAGVGLAFGLAHTGGRAEQLPVVVFLEVWIVSCLLLDHRAIDMAWLLGGDQRVEPLGNPTAREVWSANLSVAEGGKFISSLELVAIESRLSRSLRYRWDIAPNLSPFRPRRPVVSPQNSGARLAN